MKTDWIAKALLLAGLTLAACQSVQAMPAVAATAQPDKMAECSLATLKGRYLFATAGPLVPPGFGVTEPTPATSTGFHIFNGDGTGKDIVTFRVNGKTVLDKGEVPLTYKVNADCTGDYTVDIKDGPTFELFIDPDGSKFAIASTNPGNYVSTIDLRVASK